MTIITVRQQILPIIYRLICRRNANMPHTPQLYRAPRSAARYHADGHFIDTVR